MLKRNFASNWSGRFGASDHQRLPLVLFHFEQRVTRRSAEALGRVDCKVKRIFIEAGGLEPLLSCCMHRLIWEARGRETSQAAVPICPAHTAPRVLFDAQNWARRPWYTRAWFTWPLAWQAVALCALVVSAWGGLSLMSVVHGAMSGGTSAYVVTSAANDVAGFVGRAAVILEASRELCRTLLAPIARVVFAFVV